MRKRVGNAFRKAGEAVGQVDDKVQGFARKVLGEQENGRWPEKVSPFGMAKVILGEVIHGDRRTYTNDAVGRSVLGATRALQAGGLTLAGHTMLQVMDQLTQFGGAADQQTNQQIAIDYNTPAHGSTLSPESHQTYIKIHKGLMEDARVNNGYDDQIRGAYSAGEFDHDPKLKNHIADVMG